ncbi:MAG: UDP-N-acetylmuramoyl-tripeptide--D-alanyl-D-alanine ligase [Deltaproteobacteria bacterium]|nr:UDP-N-acetylmuramoyl-tripeptide--D-alanyl-D-alanine ligase [Deltaproteobacteria bacterium]MCB9488247.1 UDP-N-acetylmuramoyl-tripeptide--D-alanyl-D-alanine ligase [Deltaproteobacteria bacterium]
MIARNLQWACDAVSGRFLGDNDRCPTRAFRGVSTDTRKVRPGELFVALSGPNFDAHDFVGQALSSGAPGAVVREQYRHEGEPADGCLIGVDDPLTALGDLARAHRRDYDIPVVAITGSMGKTTTKEMIGAILRVHFGRVLVTQGNLNNRVGLPLTIFGLEPDHDAAVLEMGMSEPGEIRELARIGEPTIGVVTNVAEVHLEVLPDADAIAEAKAELLEAFTENHTAILNADDARVLAMGRNKPFAVRTFGLADGADCRATDIQTRGKEGVSFTLHLSGETRDVRLSIVGRHNVSNALAAALTGRTVGASLDEIVTGLESFRPADKRSCVLRLRGACVIDDTYNANPSSMRAALATLTDLSHDLRRVAVLGEMKELGVKAAAAHRDLGIAAAEAGVHRLIVIGPYAGQVAEGAEEAGLDKEAITIAQTHDEIVALLRDELTDKDAVLIKGSRGARMEKVVEGLREGGN